MIRTNENDMIGRRFGMLTVISRAPDKIVSGIHKTAWNCKCDCGNTCVAEQGNLITGNTKSCGCQKNKKPRRDITGQRFGHLTVIEPAPDHVRASGKHIAMWRCKCDCGNEKIVSLDNLVSGNTTSCGCTKKKRKDLLGQRFGKLVVIERAEDRFDKRGKVISRWKCKCDCGNITEVNQESLVSGNTTSCGCNLRKHGLSKSKIYAVYYGMIDRCYIPTHISYPNYGAKGIYVCDEWQGENGFLNFYNWAIENGYVEDAGLSIDRIDNNGPYAPWNCRWTTFDNQCNNRSTNMFITYNGSTHTYAEWEKIFGYPESTISNRINRNNLSPEQALIGTTHTTLPMNGIYFEDDQGNIIDPNKEE